ncbi:MAG TPA: FAD-binding domain [Candidatus Sulfotelmatobacter sp.]|nr:FAD-binding domain [Candidatus Sulfotelmatobacter sp.]
MKILISGAGIAGPTLAYWLLQYGMNPTIVEQAPALRTGGYVIDFWGAGFDIAERMDLLGEIKNSGYQVQEVRIVNERGERVAGFPAAAFARATRGRFTSLPRGDLASAIFRRVQDHAETIFGDTISSIEQSETGVHVTFKSGKEGDFDLVIGADGLHSRVRELVFGPEEKFEKYLGYKVAAFEAPGYEPRDELTYVMYTQVGQQVGRFALRGNSTMFLFIFEDRSFSSAQPDDIEVNKAILRERFGQSGWECPQILDALGRTKELYFDCVSQIRMNSRQDLWTQGRVTLLGDAAFCVSLLAGQGSALAMVAAYILAGELYRSKDNYGEAFSRYQRLFAPFVAQKQKAALRFAGSFAPHSRLSLILRNQIMNLMRIPWIANLAIGRGFSDKIVLSDYEREATADR